MLFRAARSRLARGFLCGFVCVTLAAAPVGAAGATRVGIGAASYEPSLVDLAAAGNRVRWLNTSSPSRVHDVVSSLPEYFSMPLGGNGSTYRFTFSGAGYFTYFCSIHDTMLGAVSVPLSGELAADEAGTHFRLRLASIRWPKGSRYVAAMYVQGPTDTAPALWKTAHGPSVSYVPTAAGDYRFTARVKDRETGRQSTDSPVLVLSFGG